MQRPNLKGRRRAGKGRREASHTKDRCKRESSLRLDRACERLGRAGSVRSREFSGVAFALYEILDVLWLYWVFHFEKSICLLGKTSEDDLDNFLDARTDH